MRKLDTRKYPQLDLREVTTNSTQQIQYNRQHQQHQHQQYHLQSQRTIKIEPSEVPKLSLTSIQSENHLTPPLRNRDVERIDYANSNLSKKDVGSRSKLGGSGKFPSLSKNMDSMKSNGTGNGTGIGTGSYQDEIPRLHLDQRNPGKLPPRGLQPLRNASSERLRDPVDQGLVQSSRQCPIPSLSRSQGPGSLQPLNPMLKSNSLSKLDIEPTKQSQHILETKLLAQNHKKSLAPLNNSGRIQQIQSTRPW